MGCVDEAVQAIPTRNHSFLPWLRHASAILTSLADPGWCTQRFHSCFWVLTKDLGGELGMKIVGNIHVSLAVSSCRSKTQVHSLFQIGCKLAVVAAARHVLINAK